MVLWGVGVRASNTQKTSHPNPQPQRFRSTPSSTPFGLIFQVYAPMISKELRSRPFPHLALTLHSAAAAFAIMTCPRTPLLEEMAGENGGPQQQMYDRSSSLAPYAHDKQTSRNFEHDRGLDRPVPRHATTTRHLKTLPPQPEGGREDRGLQMWRLAQKMLSLAQHPLRKQTALLDTMEGSSGSFPSIQNPLRPPPRIFTLSEGGREDRGLQT